MVLPHGIYVETIFQADTWFYHYYYDYIASTCWGTGWTVRENMNSIEIYFLQDPYV